MTKNSSSNRAVVPEAKGALDRFKFEVANELGVPLTDGYNVWPDKSGRYLSCNPGGNCQII